MQSTEPQEQLGEFELPPRGFRGDPAWVVAMGASSGFTKEQIEHSARTLSNSEWLSDMDLAGRTSRDRGLSESQWRSLLDHFRARNKRIWGEYCEAPSA